jgi:hypothetical protein
MREGLIREERARLVRTGLPIDRGQRSRLDEKLRQTGRRRGLGDNRRPLLCGNGRGHIGNPCEKRETPNNDERGNL